MADRISTLILFGATGDLARRMLLPSLYGLDSDGLLPDGLRIIGTARTALDDAAFRTRADAALQEHLPAGFYSAGIAERFLARLHYVAIDITDQGSFSKLAERIGDPCHGVAIFLSTAPSLFKPTIDGLAGASEETQPDLGAGRIERLSEELALSIGDGDDAGRLVRFFGDVAAVNPGMPLLPTFSTARGDFDRHRSGLSFAASRRYICLSERWGLVV